MAGRDEDLPHLLSRLAIGAIAGFVATMAMTAAMRRLHRRLPANERYKLPPRELADRIWRCPPGTRRT